MKVLKNLRNHSSKMSELPGAHGVRSDSDSTTLVLRRESHFPFPLGVRPYLSHLLDHYPLPLTAQ